jgi:hypothetical protein
MDAIRFTCQTGRINRGAQAADDLKRAAAFLEMSAAALEAKYAYTREQHRAHPEMYK